MKSVIRILKRSCVHINIPSKVMNLEGEGTKCLLCKKNLDSTIVIETMDRFFHRLRCAAKMNPSVGFFLENKEYGGFRLVYAHKNSVLLDRCKLVSTKEDFA